MRHRYALPLILAAAVAACSGDSGTTAPPPPPPPPTVLLKDVMVSTLPSPYYHFEYDAAGRVSIASFASGLTTYDVTYDGSRIVEMRNNTLVNHDRLEYDYDDVGRVSAVRYVDASGRVFTRVDLSYRGQKLTGVARARRVDAGFIVDKTMSLTYLPDGNLLDLTEHRRAIDGVQDETTTVDHFEQYDDGINVDDFGLIHDDFFDHLVLLPGVRLQKGNPGRVTRTGDGINFVVDFVYGYDDAHRPLTKSGSVTVTNGADAGRTFQTQSVFSYY